MHTCLQASSIDENTVCAGTNVDQFELDFTYVAYLIVLPVLILLFWVFSRREAALRDLAEGSVEHSHHSCHCLCTSGPLPAPCHARASCTAVKGSLTLLYNLHKSGAELDDSNVLPPSHLVHVQRQLYNLMGARQAICNSKVQIRQENSLCVVPQCHMLSRRNEGLSDQATLLRIELSVIARETSDGKSVASLLAAS